MRVWWGGQLQLRTSPLRLDGLLAWLLLLASPFPLAAQTVPAVPPPAPVRIPLVEASDAADLPSPAQSTKPVRREDRGPAGKTPPSTRPADRNRPANQEAASSKAKIPPSFVERVLKEILVERDLASARELLVDVLPAALNQTDNPQWIARIYILLASLAALDGDAPQAHRLALRAVALDPDVMLEPQLGELPRAALVAARKDWQGREARIKVTLSKLPLGLVLYVDGRATELPRSIMLRPGDHLFQVTGTAGVVARAWTTLAADPAFLTDPNPIPEVLRTVRPLDVPQPIEQEELSRELERMEQAQRDLEKVEARAEVELTAAKAALHMQRAACLAESSSRLRFLSDEVNGFRERLQWALDQDKPDTARHLFAMMQVARDEALRQEIEMEACLDMPLPDGTPETRVVAAPSAPSPRLSPAGQVRRHPSLPLSSMDGMDAPHIRMGGAPSLWDDTRWPRAAPAPEPQRPPPSAAVLSPDPSSSPAQTLNAQAPGAGTAQSSSADLSVEALERIFHIEGSLHGELSAQALVDTNPTRSVPSALAQGPSGTDSTGQAVGLLVTPRAELGVTNLAVRAQVPVYFTEETISIRGIELLGIAGTRDEADPTNVTGGVEARFERLRPELYSSSLGEVTRTSVRLQVASQSRPVDSVDVSLLGQALGERLEVPGWSTTPLRAGFGLETKLGWWIFPQSAVLLEGELAGMYKMNFSSTLDSSEDAWLTGIVRLRAGFDGRLGEGIWLSGQGGVQTLLTSHTGRLYALPAEQNLGGRIELRVERAPVTAGLAVIRQLEPDSLLLARQFQGAQLSVETSTTGLLALRLSGAIGSDVLWGMDVIEGQYESNGQPLYSLRTQSLPAVRGEAALRFRLIDGRVPLWLTTRYSGLARFGQWDTASPDEWLQVHQVMAGVQGRF